MAIIKLADEAWRFLRGKHAGETVDQVAESDPGYLSWAWRETSGDVSPEAFHVLDDVARRHSIDTELGRRIDDQSFRKQRITHDPSRKTR